MEQNSNVEVFPLPAAEGSIGAEHTPEVIQIAEEIVSGEYHRAINEAVIAKCIDGRNCEDALEGPNSAGGSLSLLVADDLTSQRFITSDEPIATGMARLAAKLQEQSVAIGMHGDSHASGDKSGCGANDKLPEIYAMIASKSDTIRDLAATILEQSIPDEIHNQIIMRARSRTTFDSGIQVKQVVEAVASEEATETLEGDHQEVVAVINKIPGTTLDRDALEESTNNRYQAFNVDTWAFESSARVISENKHDEIDAKVVALTYYNLATALVLCGPTMLVGIRQ